MILQKGAIAAMIEKGKGTGERFFVSCTKIQAEHKQAIVMNLADGMQSCQAILEAQTSPKNLQQFLSSKQQIQIIITSFSIYNTANKKEKKTAIIIQDFEFAQTKLIKRQNVQKSLKLQDEVKTVKKKQVKKQKQSKRSEANKQSIKLQSIQSFFPKATDTKRKQKLKLAFSQQENEETAPQIRLDVDIRSFEKIGDLYVGLFGWQILVRVIDKSYRNFISKKNTEIQILSLELIDRTGSIIQATCFGEQATHLNDTIKLGVVYRVARFKIVEENYSKSKSSKHSKLVLKMHGESSIVAVRDFKEIPLNSNNYTRLQDINNEMDMNILYDFVGILSRFQPEKVIPRAEKEIVMQSFKVCDPFSGKSFQGIIWSRQVILQKDLLNKSVLLKNFKVSKYKDSFNLTTSFKSQIVLHDFFIEKQKNCKEKSFQEYQDKNIKKLSDLSLQLKAIEKETIISDIVVWVNSIMLGSKWFYQSCPKCKKAATPFSVCMTCSTNIEDCVKRFLLNIQLCDDTGSIFVTAFEDTASTFLNGATMQNLLKMDQVQRKGFGNKCAYECFLLKINSKKDVNGRINHHIVGRPQILEGTIQCRMNLSQIKKQIENMNIINILS